MSARPRRVRVLNALASPKLALATLVLFAGYCAAAAAFVRVEWFSSPVFLVLAALVAASTAACAYRRTERALWLARTPVCSPPPAGSAGVRVPAGVSPEQALDAACAAGARLGLRPRARAEGAVCMAGGLWGLAGSPLFHWAVVLLLVAIGIGRMTRSEGRMALAEGRPKADVAEAYAHLDAGPWHGDGSGLTLELLSVLPEHVVDGLAVGDVPVVRARGTRVDVESLVYPNHPLRARTVLVHPWDIGLAPVIRVTNPGDLFLAETEAPCDFDESSPSGTTPVVFAATPADPGATAYDFSVEALAQTRTAASGGIEVRRRMPEDRAARITILPASATATASAVLRPGQAMDLPGGARIELVDVVYFAWVDVVDDASVVPIYALFALAVIGLAVAVLSPYRSLRVGVAEEDGGCSVRYAAHHGRREPTFARRFEAAVSEALSASPPEDGGRE